MWPTQTNRIVLLYHLCPDIAVSSDVLLPALSPFFWHTPHVLITKLMSGLAAALAEPHTSAVWVEDAPFTDPHDMP
jgi:hypothetical protein